VSSTALPRRAAADTSVLCIFRRMPPFLLYNSLTRSTDPFVPADGKLVRIYSCGPTVYNPAHLGNFRTFLFGDLLRRALRLYGWNVRQVMNITDVDDKIIKRAAEQKKSIRQVTEPITAIFHADREYLRIEAAEEYPKATSSIPQMIVLVQRLIERGMAYQADDRSVYFAIDRFPDYGRLSRLDRREVRTGARVAQDDYAKVNSLFFSLFISSTPFHQSPPSSSYSPLCLFLPALPLFCSAFSIFFLFPSLAFHIFCFHLVFLPP